MLDAHFDGKHIVLDQPAKLKPNTNVKVIVAEKAESVEEGDLSQWLSGLSESTFASVWDNPLDAAYDKL